MGEVEYGLCFDYVNLLDAKYCRENVAYSALPKDHVEIAAHLMMVNLRSVEILQQFPTLYDSYFAYRTHMGFEFKDPRPYCNVLKGLWPFCNPDC